MKHGSLSRSLAARATEFGLWVILWAAVITVILMTWHPWVIGSRADCRAGQRAGWDGHCRPAAP